MNAHDHKFARLQELVGEKYPDATWIHQQNTQQRVKIGDAIGIFYMTTGTFQVQGGDCQEKTFLQQVQQRLAAQNEQQVTLSATQAVYAAQSQHLDEMRQTMATVRQLVDTVHVQANQISVLQTQVETLQTENFQIWSHLRQANIIPQ